jgi:predicted nucleotide-binding protein with TIR-like domain
MPTKPKLFVASSSEAKPLADAVQQNLQPFASVTVWDQGAIHFGENTIDGLIRNCGESQFGVFVISPDDKAILRGVTLNIVRDNVILELGMFIGRIGKEKSFIIRPDRTVDLHLPSDLDGVNTGEYEPSRTDNLQAALGPVCRRIADAINRQVSQLSSQEEFLNSLVRFSLETVCRAMGMPSTPEQASLRLFIFRKEGTELVCRHYWDPNPSDEQVGVTRFPITEETAKDAIVVRCYLEKKTKRTEREEESHGSDVSGNQIQGVEGKIKSDLKYILAAPIRNRDGSIWGVLDFDTSNETGKTLLQTELAGSVMMSLVRQLQVILLQS